jgi:branched-chain amino acid transport system permease protein
VIALVLPRLASDYTLHVAVLSLIYLLPALGLNLVYGYAGLLTLAEGAFFGIGAYASALLALRLGWPFWLALPAAGAICAVLAVPMGVPALRLRSYSFVMVTLGFVVISESVSKNWIALTRGDMGLIDIPRPRLGGVALSSVTDFYYLTLALAVLATLAFHAIVASAAGRALVALRDDETLAQAYGLDTWRFKLAAFVLGALFAGLGGSVYAHYTTVLDPLVFDVFHTLTLLTIVFGGGAGTLGGVVLGTVVFVFVFRLPGGLGPALGRLARGRA